MATRKYVLKTPVDYAGVKVYELEFRPLRMRDHIEVERQYKDAGPIEKSAEYLRVMTQQDPHVIENLTHEDFMGAAEIMNDFLSTGPTTTKTT